MTTDLTLTPLSKPLSQGNWRERERESWRISSTDYDFITLIFKQQFVELPLLHGLLSPRLTLSLLMKMTRTESPE